MIKNDTLQIYRSGFLGAIVDKLNQEYPKARLNTADGIMQQLTILSGDDDTLVIDKTIDALYKDFHSMPYKLDLFRFQSKLLKTVLHVTQFTSLGEWVLNQSKSPLFSQTHREFLLDTIQFIETGRRSISIQNWIPILKNARHSTEVTFEKATLTRTDVGYNINNVWEQLIISWWSHKHGIEDFFQTMWIMYGSATDK